MCHQILIWFVLKTKRLVSMKNISASDFIRKTCFVRMCVEYKFTKSKTTERVSQLITLKNIVFICVWEATFVSCIRHQKWIEHCSSILESLWWRRFLWESQKIMIPWHLSFYFLSNAFTVFNVEYCFAKGKISICSLFSSFCSVKPVVPGDTTSGCCPWLIRWPLVRNLI